MTKNDENLQTQNSEGCTWITVNAPLLLIAGIICFLVFYQFGSRGFILVIPGAIVAVSVVGFLYQRALVKQAVQDSRWVGASIAAWAISFMVIMLVFLNVAEHLPYFDQAPGGIGLVYYCLLSMAIGPVVVLLTAGVVKFGLDIGEES